MGAQWFANLLAELRCDFPAARIFGVLDCQNHTGQALMALECGISHILVGTLAQTAFDALGQIATQRECHIWHGISLMPETDPADGLLPAFPLFIMNDHYLPASECKKRLLAHLAQQ
ncbi:hypothetical protein [Thalassospira marina]|nr:hypothetical protein [Thalassospira marina]